MSSVKRLCHAFQNYCDGMAEFAKHNNQPLTGEDTWLSVVNESHECLNELKQWQLINAIHEFFDIINALFKHLAVTYLPVNVYCSPLFWILVFPFVLPVAFKLANRYQKFQCIRNHQNPLNCNHICRFQKPPLKIYYSVSVRGQQMTQTDVREQIQVLKSYGQVLTDHLGQSNPDMGYVSDQDIYLKDQQLLQECDVFIADISSVSFGVGFMISQAQTLNKPILCLNKFKTHSVSAMIAGCPQVTIKPYLDMISYHNAIKDFLLDHDQLYANHQLKTTGLQIILVGPPGSGKSTAGRQLADQFNHVFVSTGDLCREIIKNQSHPFASEFQRHIEAGILVPAELMIDVVTNRLQQPDCQIKGYILDGYPGSQTDLDYMMTAKINPNLLFILTCPDSVAIQRQCQRGQRVTDENEKATHRVQHYHEQLPSFIQLKNTPVIMINANQKPEQVQNDLAETIKNWIQPDKGSYFPIKNNSTQSTRFHFHIDAKNSHKVRQLINSVYCAYPSSQGQIKIYPISHLNLGSQAKSLEVYQNMSNFHTINNAVDEAFATGCFGQEYNYDFMNAVCQTAKDSQLSCSVELEQYLGEWQLWPDGDWIAETDYVESDIVTLPSTFESNMLKEIPKYELHHGFNLPKTSHINLITNNPQPPIDLEHVNQFCVKNQINNGGWFIFEHPKHWSYRSNEFVNCNSETAKDTLYQQAQMLQQLLIETGYVEVNVLSSLERVHTIYKFE